MLRGIGEGSLSRVSKMAKVKGHYRQVGGKRIKVKGHTRRTPGSYKVARIQRRGR